MKQPYDEEKDEWELFEKDPQFRPINFTTQELLQYTFDSEKVRHIRMFIDENSDDIMQSMQNHHWLNVIWSLFKEHEYDVRRMFRYTLPPEVFNNRDLEGELKGIFGGQ
jgi:hypothetical protein